MDRLPIDDVVAACRERLETAGFRKRAGEVFTFDVCDEVLGWLGLNRAVRRGDGLMEVNPVVGVRHQAIERAVAELTGRKFHSYVPPTVSLHLGYLMPEKRYRPWLFDHGNVGREVDAMTHAVEAYGLPFMKEHASVDSLISLMTDGDVGVREHVAYRLPIAHRLVGDDETAMRVLDAALEDLGVRSDVAAERFRAFSETFRRQTRL